MHRPDGMARTGLRWRRIGNGAVKYASHLRKLGDQATPCFWGALRLFIYAENIAVWSNWVGLTERLNSAQGGCSVPHDVDMVGHPRRSITHDCRRKWRHQRIEQLIRGGRS